MFSVAEEDEVSIKEAAELVIEGMDFKGQVVVSLLHSFSYCDMVDIRAGQEYFVLKYICT